MMFLEILSPSNDTQIAQLKRLAALLETYPRTLSEHFLFGMEVAVHDKDVFEELFGQLSRHYRECIDAYGWDRFLEQVRSKEPTIPFMAEGKEGEDYKRNILIRVIYSDLRHYFYGTDDFVSLQPEAYDVHQQIGLERDDENLTTINSDFELRRQGIIYKGHHLIFYHPFLRRFFRANFTEVTTCILNLSKLPECTLKVAVDPFRLTRRESYREIMEFDHWWGKKFDPAKLNDPHFTFKNIYGRQPEDFNNHTLPIDRIEVKAQHRNNEKIFEIEEITPPPSLLHREEYNLGKHALSYSERFRFVKYAHFIWDVASQHFCHLDIAVIIYDLEKYEDRFALRHPGIGAVEKVDKIKLVRVDGKIPLEAVEHLCTDFYRYNELIGEFFAGK